MFALLAILSPVALAPAVSATNAAATAIVAGAAAAAKMFAAAPPAAATVVDAVRAAARAAASAADLAMLALCVGWLRVLRRCGIAPQTDAPSPVQVVPVDATMVAPTMTMPPAKSSPARPDPVLRSRKACLLVVTSHSVSAAQQSDMDRARRILHDQLVVFHEVDAAAYTPQDLEWVSAVSGEPKGVYPQVFLATRSSMEYVSLQQLDTAEYYSDASLEQLAAAGKVRASGPFLFRDVSTRRPPSPAFDAQMRTLAEAEAEAEP